MGTSISDIRASLHEDTRRGEDSWPGPDYPSQSPERASRIRGVLGSQGGGTSRTQQREQPRHGIPPTVGSRGSGRGVDERSPGRRDRAGHATRFPGALALFPHRLVTEQLAGLFSRHTTVDGREGQQAGRDVGAADDEDRRLTSHTRLGFSVRDDSPRLAPSPIFGAAHLSAVISARLPRFPP